MLGGGWTEGSLPLSGLSVSPRISVPPLARTGQGTTLDQGWVSEEGSGRPHLGVEVALQRASKRQSGLAVAVLG